MSGFEKLSLRTGTPGTEDEEMKAQIKSQLQRPQQKSRTWRSLSLGMALTTASWMT